MSDIWDGSRLILGRSDLDELELHSSFLFSVGVPIRADPEFKAFVFAAAAAHALGNKWIDSHLRHERQRLIDQFSAPPTTREEHLAALLSDVRRCADDRIAQLVAIDLTAATDGLRAGANNLIRLQSTFRAASQLIRLGFAFEAEAVIRLGFEQVGWAHAVADLTTAEEIEATKVEHTPNRLKPLVPDAGRLYGRLSNLAHMAPSTHDRFLRSNAERRQTIGIQLPEAAAESMELLIELLDAFLLVSDVRFAPFGIAAASYGTSTGSPMADRPARVFAARLAALRNAPADAAPTLDELIG